MESSLITKFQSTDVLLKIPVFVLLLKITSLQHFAMIWGLGLIKTRVGIES